MWKRRRVFSDTRWRGGLSSYPSSLSYPCRENCGGFRPSKWSHTSHSCYICAEWNYLPAAQCGLQKICPILHHFGARLQVEGMVIGRAHGVAWGVGKLQFDVLMPIALFV